MRKIGLGLLVAGIMGIGGCSPEDQKRFNGYPNSAEPSKSAEMQKTYEFKNFGEVDDFKSPEKGWGNDDITQIETADLDGDGDLDIIVGTADGEVIAYENKIPQKSE